MSLKKILEHLKSRLLWHVAAAIALGWPLGYVNGPFIKQHQPTLKTLITMVVFLMIYPMMINIRLEALAKAVRNLKGLGLTLGYNFVWAPLFGFALSKLFLHDPEVGFGFLLVMVVPCSSMSIGYTGLAEGNLELATVAVATSFVTAIAAIPFWLGFLGGSFNVPVPMGILLNAVLTVLILPMVLGYITRLALTRWLGESGFRRLAPLFPSITLVSMYLIIFLIFFMKAAVLVQKWQLMVWLIVPNLLFVTVTLAAITWVNKQLGLSYADHMGIIFASTGKNNGTAIALATAAFSPLVAVPAATLPIFQIIFLVGYIKLEDWVRQYFGARAKASAAAEVSPTLIGRG
ncbi:MAG TPA: arsenic resistance protein [Anaerolineae bacterium]|nr:arsenic resistance protein [Anaerolineae bacterium]HIQ05790.1 arsenic resistance protein [Anaerolineae bacterium]